MCHLDKYSLLSRSVQRSTPSEIGESRVAGGSCKRISTTRACVWKRRRGMGGRPENTAGLDVWLRVWLVVCFNVSLNLSFYAEEPPTSSLSSRSPPAVLASNVCSWHTTCVFACVLGLRWIGSGTRSGRSPSTFRTLLRRTQGARDVDEDVVVVAVGRRRRGSEQKVATRARRREFIFTNYAGGIEQPRLWCSNRRIGISV